MHEEERLCWGQVQKKRKSWNIEGDEVKDGNGRMLRVRDIKEDGRNTVRSK